MPSKSRDQIHTVQNQQGSSRFRQEAKERGKFFSVYVGGLSDGITLLKLEIFFRKAGRVKEVFIQFRRKIHWRYRYGFVRFGNEEDAQRAIRLFNGACLEGNYIVVQNATLKKNHNRDKGPGLERKQLKEQRKVWRPKAQQTKLPNKKQEDPTVDHVSVQPQEDASNGAACQLRLSGSDLDSSWFQRCARARTLESKPVNVIQDELAQIGMYNFRFIPLGDKEVLLEFEDKEEMESTLAECSFFLEQKLAELRPCTMLTYGLAHLVWIRLWQVPLGLWSESFFTAVGNRLGSFVDQDPATKFRYRADFARILVRMNHPLLHCFTMAVDVDGTSCIILVEKDDSVYDYGTVKCMPTTPVKIYNSEDDIQSFDDSENNDDRDVDEVRAPVHYFEKDYESAVDVDSDEEDEAYRDEKMDGENEFQVEDAQSCSEVAGEIFSSGCFEPQDTMPAAAVSGHEGRLAADDVGVAISNSNALLAAIKSGEEKKEQLQVLLESGYTLNELDGWWKKINDEGIMINRKKISYDIFENSDINMFNNFDVAGFASNQQSLNQNYIWPLFSTYWDPQYIYQQHMLRTCLPSYPLRKNNLFSSATYPSLTTSGRREQHPATREIFLHTKPYQIVRLSNPDPSLPVVHDIQEEVNPQGALISVQPEPVMPTPFNSPNTNSSKKKGRPKGSKNKPIALPHDFLPPVTGEDGVSTRSQRAWLLGQQLGLKPRGSEALMLRALEAQIRENHPHLN